jgi:hypothetical protein
MASGTQRLSPRAAPVRDCAAIPETLLEAELFGHKRGAFTGVVQSRVGKVHSAHNGTLLLDEIGEMPMAVPAKLLRFLENREVQRLGSSDTFRVDVREARELGRSALMAAKIIAEISRDHLSPNKLSTVNQLQADLILHHRTVRADPSYPVSRLTVRVLNTDNAALLQRTSDSFQPSACGGYIDRPRFMLK